MVEVKIREPSKVVQCDNVTTILAPPKWAFTLLIQNL
jgi:hypothetical protein